MRKPRVRLAGEASRPANIREVADEAGVSIATISRALQDPGRLKPKTRERVEAAIQKLGYTPNVQARSLRTAQTKLIVALVPDFANPFAAEVVRGIERVAHESGYSVLLGDTQFDQKRELNYANMIAARQADGLITTIPNIPRLLVDGRPPLVNACECVDSPGISSVGVDNFKAAIGAVEYLLDLGHRRIACLSGPLGPVCADREAGAAKAMADAGLSLDPGLVLRGPFTPEFGIRAVETLFARGARFTALFCSNDEMALGAIHAVRARGLRVPEDVSIMGFDDIRLARYFDPPLTTVAQPMMDIGMEAARLLLDVLTGQNPPPQKRILPTQLIIRASTARCGDPS